MDPTDEFNDLLKKLTTSKEAISKTTKYALDYEYFADDLFDILLKRLKKSSFKRKLSLLYLLDSLAQNAKIKDSEDYLELISQRLSIVIRYLLFLKSTPKGSNASLSSLPNEEEEARQKIIQALKKCLLLWEERKIYSNEIIQKSLEILEEYCSGRRRLADEEILQKIEADRRENKRKRWESTLRPDNDTEYGEFDDIFNGFNPKKMKIAPKYPTLNPFSLPASSYQNNIPPSYSTILHRKLWPLKLLRDSEDDLLSKLKKRDLQKFHSQKNFPLFISSPSPSAYSPSKEEKSSSVEPINSIVENVPSSTPFPQSSSTGSTPSEVMYSPASPSSSPLDMSFEQRLSDVSYSCEIPLYVYIWDLDESLLVFNSLILGDFPTTHKKDLKRAYELGSQMKDLLYKVLEEHMFFRDLEVKDFVKGDCCEEMDDQKDLSSYPFSTDMLRMDNISRSDAKKIAYRFRIISEYYLSKRRLPEPIQTKLDSLLEEIDKFTDSWLSLTKEILKISTSNKFSVHTVVTSGHILPILSKMIMYKLNSFIPYKNVYSSNTVGKLFCFKKIQEQFPNSKIIVLGDGKEEEEAAVQENFTFYKISSPLDLINIYSKLLTTGIL